MGKNISKKATAPGGKGGLKVDRYFSKDGKNVYDLFKYEKRSSVIRNPSGDAVFEMNDVEVAHGSINAFATCTSGSANTKIHPFAVRVHS